MQCPAEQPGGRRGAVPGPAAGAGQAAPCSLAVQGPAGHSTGPGGLCLPAAVDPAQAAASSTGAACVFKQCQYVKDGVVALLVAGHDASVIFWQLAACGHPAGGL